MSQTRAQLLKGFSNTSAPADAITVDSNGDIGINNSAPADKLHVGGNIRFGTNTTYYGVIEHEAGVTGANIYTSKDTGGHIFKTGTTPAEVVRIQNGGGISFGGDTAATNALDDYEEGTFTPAFKDSGYTYSQQHGNYTKIGNRVLFNIFLSWSANTASGNAVIDGFTHAVPNALQYYGAAAITNNGVTLPSGTDTVVAQISPTGPEIAIYAADSGTSKVHITNSQMGSSGEVIISGQYFVA